jgi:hypothetical protein
MDVETWRHTDIEMETRKHGDIDIETWRHGEMETWRYGDRETWKRRHGHSDIKRKMKNGSPGDFTQSVYRLLTPKQKLDVCPFVAGKKQMEVMC